MKPAHIRLPNNQAFKQFLADLSQLGKQYPRITQQPTERTVKRDPLSPMQSALAKVKLL